MISIDAYKQIIVDLERVGKSKVAVFGSEKHEFRLHSPMSEEELGAFECEYGVRLPEDYRMFLIQVGRGGAGPYYGLYDLGCIEDGLEWNHIERLVGTLANPFPYSAPWNDLTGEPDDDLDDEEYERQLQKFDERYWAPLNGTHGVFE